MTGEAGAAHPEVLIVGYGNVLRGDDGVGSLVVRHLAETDVPEGVRLVDGATAGMDVAFHLEGAGRVVIVDAAATGAAPGTVVEMTGAELAERTPLRGLHSHSMRWDHALAFARWALGDDCPTDVTVFLVEIAGVDLGAELSAPVRAAMERVVDVIEARFVAPLRRPQPGTAGFPAGG